MKKYKFSILNIILIAVVCIGIGFALNATLDNRTEAYSNLILNIDTMQAKINTLEEKIARIEEGDAAEQEDSDTTEKEEINIQTKEAATDSAIAASEDEMVYKTKTGKKYHKEECGSLNKSAIAIRLEEAKAAGLEPCKKCFK